MLILDYPRTMDAGDPSILISPFHTGHLGLRPNTEVTLQLLKAPRNSTAFCELILSPDSRSQSGSAVLTAVMRDERGVVQRLVRAIAELGINIDAEESASIGHLDRHSVRLTLNLDSMHPGADPGSALQPGPYREYAPYVPLHDRRCRRIFETVMRRCVDVLAMRRGGEQPTLDLSIRLLDVPDPNWTGTTKLLSDTKQKVKVPLPDTIRRAIETEQGVDEGPNVDYVFLSDTEDRTLRVFFLRASDAKSLYHVAIHHRDRASALGTLLTLIRDAEFNILTSLVGSGERPGENVWEAVLQYQGHDPQPDRPDNPAPDWFANSALPWFRDKLAAVVDDPQTVATFEFVLSAPSYPRTAVPVKRLPLMDVLATEGPAVPARLPKIDNMAEIELRRRAIANLPAAERDLRYSILERVGQQRAWPTIYLACTEEGIQHAQKIKARLSEHYDVKDHCVDQSPENPERASDIGSSDYFIGLWHHDKRAPQGPGTFGGSPWLHFQRGLAIASGKPTLVIRSADADPKFWGAPGPDHIVYWDLDFASETLTEIENYCRDHFN